MQPSYFHPPRGKPTADHKIPSLDRLFTQSHSTLTPQAPTTNPKTMMTLRKQPLIPQPHLTTHTHTHTLCMHTHTHLHAPMTSRLPSAKSCYELERPRVNSRYGKWELWQSVMHIWGIWSSIEPCHCLIWLSYSKQSEKKSSKQSHFLPQCLFLSQHRFKRP